MPEVSDCLVTCSCFVWICLCSPVVVLCVLSQSLQGISESGSIAVKKHILDQLTRSNQSYKLRELISALFTRIFPYGVTQLVTGPTRHFPGQVSSGLDHYYFNRPDKMSAV